MKAKERSEELLAGIREISTKLKAREAEAEKALAAVQAKFADIPDLQERLNALDAELKKLMKKAESELFGGSDSLRLNGGALFKAEEDKVRIPKTALSAIKNEGWLEAIKTVESVKREIVEKWPVERLAAIGAEKKPHKSFSYQLKGAK